ncbi:hypothetical protein M3I53_29000 [Paraburkholderia sp. CNPSo 3272]|nr:hypothetical protein [Paraburkholderia sp. CNPSo 3272]MCP3727114.1 hypothetical protein [Paraburkholderia sp. CNPSo 3272]
MVNGKREATQITPAPRQPMEIDATGVPLTSALLLGDDSRISELASFLIR